jgi:dienelactone hydrolase
VTERQRRLRFCSTVVLCSAIAGAAHACAPAASPRLATPDAPQQPAAVAQEISFQTSVDPRADEDLAAACRYEITIMDRSRQVRGVWVIFERSLDMLRYYRDADVRAFARRHDLALLYPFHCKSKTEAGGDMNVEPARGIGRALFAALEDFAQSSKHPELASAGLILLGFSGTGSLVGRLADFASNRVLAVIPTDPGHFDPLGVDTISLSPQAAEIPHLILVGSSDAVSGTERPYAYFRKYFDQGSPWTFVVQNRAPHCCILNAKGLILEWVDAVVVQRLRRMTGQYGFIETRPSEATDCPDQSPPVRSSWCRSTRDTWGGENWSVNTATIEQRPNPPKGMRPSGWLPTEKFAKQWIGFVTQPEHPVTLPP